MTDPRPSAPGQEGAAERNDRLVALLERSRTGDRDAFAELYDAVAPAVYGLARRVVVDPELASDVVQDTLLDVWRSADRFRAGQGSVIGWVCSIAHRRAVDQVRSSQARREREQRAGPASFVRDHDQVSEEVGDAVAASEDRHRVQDCLETLTGLEREAITAAYYGGMSYPEVAERVGAGLSAVKSRMRSGLRRLQECLGVRA